MSSRPSRGGAGASRTEERTSCGWRAARDRLLPDAVALLKEHKKIAFANGHAKPGDFVFTTATGAPHSYKNVLDRCFNKGANDAGLNPEGTRKLVPHHLRHSAISRWIALGIDAVTIARWAGDTVEVILSTHAGEFDKVNRATTSGSGSSQAPRSG